MTEQCASGALVVRRTETMLGFATAFLWFGILIAWVSGDFAISPDSKDYQVGQGFPISFVGDAWRAWPTPLLFSITPDYRMQTLIQAMLLGLSWTAVLWVFLRRSQWRVALCASAPLVALALTPLYLQWTLTILSEATTLSFVLLGLSASQEYVNQSRPVLRSTWLCAALGSSALLAFAVAAMTRLTLVIVLISTGVTLVALAVRVGQRTVAVALAALAVVLVGYTWFLNVRIDEHWGMSRSATYYGYLTASETPLQSVLADPLFAYISERGPDCLAGYRASAGGATGPDPWQFRGELSRECPDGVAWLEESFQSEYAKFLTTHPSYAARFVLHYLPRVGDLDGYVGVTSVLPAFIADIYSSSRDGLDEYRPIYLWLVIWFASSIVATRRMVRRLTSSRHFVVPFAIAGSSVLALLVTVLTLNSEVARIASQATALLIASTILTIAGLTSKGGRFVRKE
jgi:hypothetical protein